VLERNLANERIFPSLNISLSGTRREELLFGSAVMQHQALRRSLARMSPRDAMLAVLKLIRKYPTNELLLAKF
jgi:transcription termination factor Rho